MGVSDTLGRWRSFIAYWYLQWELCTSLYMMEPLEKAIIHSIIIAVFGVLLYAGLTYLPGHLIMMLHFFEGVPDDPPT